MLAFSACIGSDKYYLFPMNSTNRDTLKAVFSLPVPKSLHFSAIESLLKALGCKVVEGDGSRVRFVKDNSVLALHRPHPGKEAKPYQIKDVRAFLQLIGVTKEDV